MGHQVGRLPGKVPCGCPDPLSGQVLLWERMEGEGSWVPPLPLSLPSPLVPPAWVGASLATKGGLRGLWPWSLAPRSTHTTLPLRQMQWQGALTVSSAQFHQPAQQVSGLTPLSSWSSLFCSMAFPLGRPQLPLLSSQYLLCFFTSTGSLPSPSLCLHLDPLL